MSVMALPRRPRFTMLHDLHHMNTWLLTWNPKYWEWGMESDFLALKKQGFFDGHWSCGRTKRIEPGDRIFLFCQAAEPRGILSSGHARSSSYYKAYWDESRENQARYVDVRFDALLVPEEDNALAVTPKKWTGM